MYYFNDGFRQLPTMYKKSSNPKSKKELKVKKVFSKPFEKNFKVC